MDDNQPKGIGFFNIKSGETHYARLEPQIQAYINSSDMGINASHDQDFGWRLEPEWVKRVKAFRRDENKMERLVSRNGGQKVTTPQILYAIYGEQLRVHAQQQEDEALPFEEEYLSKVSDKSTAKTDVANDEDFDKGAEDATTDTSTDSASSAAEPVQEVNATGESNKPADSPKKSNKK